jgi:putative peptide zinc metalloprotease protein
VTSAIRRLVLLLVAALLAFGLAATRPAVARADGGDTAAIAINTKDGSAVFKFAFAIKRVAGDVVDNTNAAVAFASCTDCQTVAISIQIVLITGDPSVVTPTNLALAVNVLCSMCETLASAYQYAFSTGGPVHFTADGNKALAEIRKEIRDLGKQDLSIQEIQARLDELTGRLEEVLRNELVVAGHPKEQGGTQTGTEAQPAPETTTTSTEPTTATTTGPRPTTESTPTSTTETTASTETVTTTP